MKIDNLAPFVVLTVGFFATNFDVDRGEYGGLYYTLSKIAPIVALTVAGAQQYLPGSVVGKVGFNGGKNFGVLHPAFVAFLLAAIGDVLLAYRSLSMTAFAVGTAAFAFSHLCIFQYHWRLSDGALQLWFPALAVLLMHAVAMMMVCFQQLSQTSLLFQAVIGCYSLVLAASVWRALSAWRADFHDPATAAGAIGYLSFMLSDSLIMFDTYGRPVARSQVYVLITYYLAQVLIFIGMVLRTGKITK